MKNYFILFILLLATTAPAQEPIEVKVKNQHTSMGMQPAFEVVVPQSTAKDAIDLFKKKISPDGLFKKSVKVEKIKDEYHIKDVVIGNISSQLLNIIVQVSEYPGNINLRFFLQSGNGFVGADSLSQRATDAALNYFSSFAVDLYKQAVEKELKEEGNVLKSLEKDLIKLEKSNKKYDSKISDAKQESKELQESTKSQQELLKKSIEMGTTSEASDAEMKKQLKSDKKDLKKAQKYQKRYEKKTDKNIDNQTRKAEEIKAQQEKIKVIKIKLENIK
jgi:hypothetical protein